mgnify:CR=1 FL=1
MNSYVVHWLSSSCEVLVIVVITTVIVAVMLSILSLFGLSFDDINVYLHAHLSC